MNEEENLKVETSQEENLGEETTEMTQNSEKECCLECTEETTDKGTFLNSLSAIIVDQVCIATISAVGIFLLIAILNIFGYRILSSYYVVFLFITYVLISIIYPVIMEASTGNTLGRKVCKLKVFKIK